MKKILLFAFILFVATITISCSKENVEENSEMSLSGTSWQFVAPTETLTFNFTSGSSVNAVWTVNASSVVSMDELGTYVYVDPNITITYIFEGTTFTNTGIVSGNTMTLTEDGFTFVFIKI